MENKTPGPSKGYQKQVKKDATNAQQQSKAKKSGHPDYSSPTHRKKWSHFVEAVESGNVDDVKRLIEEGLIKDAPNPGRVHAADDCRVKRPYSDRRGDHAGGRER